MAMVLIAIMAPYIAPFDPEEVHVIHQYSGPGTTIEETGENFWLGNDQLGRDTLSRLIYGARIALYVSLISVGIGVTVGSLIGILSAYFGGVLDLTVQRLVDSLMAFPAIILALSIVAISGSSMQNVIIALVVIFIPGSARLIRSQAMAVREMDYMLAGKALGAGEMRLVFRHMVPNCMAQYIVFATANFGHAIVVEASLSFLGVGVPPEVPTWGGMLSEAGQKYIEVAPWLIVFPSIAICVVVFAFNLLGDSLRDVLDPRLRGAQ